jgi:TonB family protein
MRYFCRASHFQLGWHLTLRQSTAGRIVARALLQLVFMGWASSACAQSSEIDALAADAATAISYKYKDVKNRPRVLVEDFIDDQRSGSSLGLKLADEFQADLKARAKDFFVIDRAEHRELSAQEVADQQAGCPAPKSEPEVSVRGYYQAFPGNDIALRIEVLQNRRILVENKTRFTLTPASLNLYTPEPKPDHLRGKIVWVRADSAQIKTEKPVRLTQPGDKGYAMPICLYCPHPAFSDEAVRVKAEGNVLLDIEVDAGGQIGAISVVKPLPCGLTEKAVEAVEHWRFKPATDADGKPTAVVTQVEISLGLY